MTTQDLSAILADAVAAADKYHWSRLRDFAADLPDDHEVAVLLLASADTEPGPLARWVGSVAPSVPVRAESLEALAGRPELNLQANRVIVAFRCGELLTPEAVDSGTHVTSRPTASYLIVMTGAELIRSEDDLALVQRSMWRLVLSEHGDEWAGQSLAEHGCVLWSDAEPAAFLAERMASDREILATWLAAEVDVTDRLRAERVACALDLAEVPGGQRLGDLPDPAIAAHRLASAQEAVIKGRRRVLGGLDADTRNAEREIIASLAMQEQDLLTGVATFIAEHRDDVTDVAAARTLIGQYTEDGLNRWQASAEASLRAQSERITDNLRDLVDGMEWQVIDRAGGPYPRAAFTGSRLDASLATGEASVPQLRPAGKSQFTPGTANVVIGGAVGASVGAILGAGVGFAPGLIAGAAGALVLNRILTDRNVEHMVGKARKFIAACTATARDAALTRFRQAAAEQRAAVTDAFDDLERALTDRARAAETDSGAGLLAGLRERLRAAAA
jgi:hypothetical protein